MAAKGYAGIDTHVHVGTGGWIVSRRVDLALIVGSAAAGYLYLALNVIWQVPITLLWWVWSIGFDGTHIFGMASRTYFDREAMSRHGRMLIGGLVFFFAIGPVMVLLGWRVLLAILVGTWAYYHVMRQHYGFLVLYQAKLGRVSSRDTRLDWIFLIFTLAAPPFLRFFVNHPKELGLPERFALANVFPWSEALIYVAVAVVAAKWILRQMERRRQGESLNAKRLLLLAGVVPLHWLTFYFMSWQAAVPTVTIVHNLQYHALIWHHNRGRYGHADVTRHGRIPKAVSRSLLIYVGLALAFSLLYRVPGFHLGRVSNVAFGFFCGFGLTHYWLDSKIWRVRHDPELRAVLGLG